MAWNISFYVANQSSTSGSFSFPTNPGVTIDHQPKIVSSNGGEEDFKCKGSLPIEVKFQVTFPGKGSYDIAAIFSKHQFSCTAIPTPGTAIKCNEPNPHVSGETMTVRLNFSDE